MKNKLLLTFDLNCLLGYAAPVKKFMKENSQFLDFLPTKVENGYNIWTRPNLDILVKNMFFDKKDCFDVGIWSSHSKENTAFLINSFLGSLKYSLKFILFTKPEIETDSLLPVPVKRDLKIIFNKHDQYDEKNTVLFTNFKNELSDYRNNEIILPLYHPELGTTQYDQDGHMYFVHEYITILNSHIHVNKIDDIREMIKMLPYDKMTRVRTGNSRPDRNKWDSSNNVRF
jgi:hypothetical protein